MPKLRVLRATATSPVYPRLRVTRVTATGTAAVVPRLRVLRVTAAGPAAVFVNALPNLADVEPETVLSVAATLAGGGAADSWTWRRVSGPATTIVGTTGTVQITAPSHIDGASVVIGVRATKDGITSPEVTFSIAVLPQTEWWWTGTAWTPKVEVWV